MDKKKNAVMLADTRPALVGVVLLQLQETNKGLFDEAIIYYLTEICEHDKRKMRSIMPCRFIKYVCPLPEEILKKPRFKLFSPLMFARYEMTEYLDEFETITWLDTDILIQGDISGLIAAAEKTGAALIREDPLHKTAEKPDRMRTCFSREIGGFQLDEYLYCSGTIVYTDKCIGFVKGFTKWCYEKTYEWADVLELPDQGVINAAIQNFQLQITPLTGRIYCCYPYMNRDCSEAGIIHAWGLNKFWNDWYVYKNYSGWAGVYEKWVKEGGSPLPFAIRPEVSVVIPVYKPDLALFRQCMDSLMKQNRDSWERYSDFEILIIAEPYEHRELKEFVHSYHDSRIKLMINEERKGIAASLNKGMKEAQGRYIARMDDDDIAAGRRMYLQKMYLDRHPEYALCTSDFEYFGDMNERRISFEGEMARAWSVFTCPFDHPTIMFRRDFFVDNDLFYDEKRGFVEDWELWQRAFEKGMTAGCVHEVLLHHRWMNHAGAGQSSRTVDMMREMIRENFRRLEVDIAEEDLQHIGPWNGMVLNQDAVRRVERYFEDALNNNRRLFVYDQDSLKQAFRLRLTEIHTGILPGLSEKLEEKSDAAVIRQEKYQKKSSFWKLIVKRLLLPLYQPVRNRYEERLKFIVEKELANEGHIMDCIYKLDEQSRKIEKLAAAVENQWDIQDQWIKESAVRWKECQEICYKHMNAAGHMNSVIQENRRQNELLNDKVYDLLQEVRYIKELRESGLKTSRKIVLIATPEHSNAGDAAITLGEIEFIRRYFGEYDLVELSKYDYEGWIDRIKELIGKEDLIFLQGGGNIGSRYIDEEKIRREIIESFPENQIVIMPQTIWFEQTPEGAKERRKSSDIYNSHKNLTIFTRGLQSLQMAQTYFANARSAVMLDMALMLRADFRLRREGVLLCMRKPEDEGCFSPEDYERLLAMLKEEQLAYDIETNWNKDSQEENIYKDMRRSVVYEKLKKYAAHRLVITDRLHGMIFAVITSTPCIVLSTYNGKTDEFYHMLEESNAVFFAGKKIESVNEQIRKACMLSDISYPALNQGYFEKMAGIIQGMEQKHNEASD